MPKRAGASTIASLSAVPVFGAAFGLAALEWLCAARGWRSLEFVFKPAVLLVITLAVWVICQGPHGVWTARFFLPALALSLPGDVLLLLRGRGWFLAGLTAFLLAHVCYVIGMNPALPPRNAFVFLIPIGALGIVLCRGVAAGLRAKNSESLQPPLVVYTMVLCLMLFSAWACVLRPSGSLAGPALIAGGASLFFASDALLAWNRFVRPLPSGRLPELITYHLAQIALAGSIALVGW